MKKIITSMIFMGLGYLSQAQVIITEQADPTLTNSSVLLEFGSQPKGIILPSVASAPGAVGGTFIVNTTDKAVQYHNGTGWVNLTDAGIAVANPFVNDGTTDIADGVIIGANTTDKPGALVLESTTQALVLPRVASPQNSILNPVAGTMVYDTDSDAVAVYDGKYWAFWAADASGILNGITLVQNQRYFVASIYDKDYLPFILPTGPATIDRPVAADGTDDPKTIDVQGQITTTGVEVRIPVASAVGSGSIGEWTSTFVVPAIYAEDGISRTLELSWTTQTYTASTKYITATIKSLDGTFNALKLDMQAGLGNDFLGVLMGAFQYPYNDAGDLTTYQVRDITAIPDRKFGLLDNVPAAGERHNFLYLPVSVGGNIWLNNNLGAAYANVNHAEFDLSKQAQSPTDWKAYGSLFQWGRNSDGHELTNYTGPTTGSAVYSLTTTRYSTVAPTGTPLVAIDGNSGNIPPNINPRTWTTSSQINNMWQPETQLNNPCPHGFRVPTVSEYQSLVDIYGTDVKNSPLKLTYPGFRSYPEYGYYKISEISNAGYYWASDVINTTYGSVGSYRIYSPNYENVGTSGQNAGNSLRCIKE